MPAFIASLRRFAPLGTSIVFFSFTNLTVGIAGLAFGNATVSRIRRNGTTGNFRNHKATVTEIPEIRGWRMEDSEWRIHSRTRLSTPLRSLKNENLNSGIRRAKHGLVFRHSPSSIHHPRFTFRIRLLTRARKARMSGRSGVTPPPNPRFSHHGLAGIHADRDECRTRSLERNQC